MAPVDLPGEPLVVAGTKYRIREVVRRSTVPGVWTIVRARLHFGAGMPEAMRWVTAEVTEYDPIAGVFRGREVEA